MGEGKKRTGLSASFITGAVALVFIVIGYQFAVFLNRAAVSKFLADRHPDTVFVYLPDKGKAQEADGNLVEPSDGNTDKKVVGKTGEKIGVVSDADKYSSVKYKKNKTVETFRFNPNTVSVRDLQRLGFSEKQAAAIDGYRKKGGRFCRKSDFAKSFIVSDSVYKRLERYIDIPLLDLNMADSAALDDLPGIGGYFASEIIKYRECLGGYSFKEQLMEIYRFDKEKFDGLSDLVEIRTETPYPLWTYPVDSLRLHPYLKPFPVAMGIVLYRENNPKELWTVDGLHDAGVISDETAEKLSRCVIAVP